MSKEAKKSTGAFAFLKRRQLRIGGYAILVTLMFITLAVALNLGVEALEDRFSLRLDCSYNNLTQFSEQTVTALQALDEAVTFYILAAPGAEDPLLMEVLSRYHSASSRVSVETVDPDQNPGLVNRFRSVDSPESIGANTVIVTNASETRSKIYLYTDLVEYAYDEASRQYYIQGYQFERMFTQGMLYVTAERTPAIYVLQGHGEVSMSHLASMTELLEANNYSVQPLTMADGMPCGNNDLLLILSPQKDITEGERDAISAYLENGGNMLYTCDIIAPNNLKNIGTLLDCYGIGYREGVVVADVNDASQYYPMQPLQLLPLLGDHDITQPLIAAGQQVLLVPQTRAVLLPEMQRNDFVTTTLLSSFRGSYLFDITDSSRTTLNKQPGDPSGPFALAVSVQRLNAADDRKESRALFFGSSLGIASEQVLTMFNNAEFLLSSIKWATKDETLNLGIVSKTAQRETLAIQSASQFYTLGALLVAAPPLLVLLAGIIVWLRRRHL